MRTDSYILMRPKPSTSQYHTVSRGITQYDPALSWTFDKRGRSPSGTDTDSYRKGGLILVMIEVPPYGENPSLHTR